MQISSLLNGAAMAVAFVSMLGIATLAYADSLKPSAQQATAVDQSAAAAQPGATNSGPYDGPDFTVPESNIYP